LIVRSYAAVILIFSFILFNNGCRNPYDAGPGPNEIWIYKFEFNPVRLTASPGTTVIWFNLDEITHRVRSGLSADPDSLFDSGDIAHEDTFRFTFDSAGNYNFYDVYYPSMIGSVTIDSQQRP
jgi:plastocyanin